MTKKIKNIVNIVNIDNIDNNSEDKNKTKKSKKLMNKFIESENESENEKTKKSKKSMNKFIESENESDSENENKTKKSKKSMNKFIESESKSESESEKSKKIKKKSIKKIFEDNSNKSENMTFIDLCCGIGGFHQALNNMKMKCVLASDIDRDCRDNYELNYKIKPYGDLSKINIKIIPNFDVLCAGFPCQPFSKAGKQEGFDDKRGNIFFDICNIIKFHKPKYIILENVRNLASHDNGNTWKIIKKKLDELNYYTYEEPIILNTLYFGIPQSRERVVILCKRKDIGILPKLPNISKKNIKETSLLNILEKKPLSKYKICKKLQVTQNIWNKFLDILIKNKINIPKFPIWTDWWDSDGNNTTITKYNNKLSKEDNDNEILKKQKNFYKKYKTWIDKNREFYNKNKNILKIWLDESRKCKEWVGALRKMEYQVKNDEITMENVLWSPRGSGIRIKNIDYSPTLVAMASMIPIYGKESRHLTPRECARLQSFPEDYIIHENDKVAYKQFGNAVNVKMIEKCAKFLINNESLF